MIMLLLVTTVTTALGQSAKFGIKGGLNFGNTGDITTITNESFSAENRVGFHVGLLGQIKFSGIFLQPEVVYTEVSSEFANDIDSNFNVSQLDIPVLLGFDIIGPLNVKAGPAFQLQLSNDFDTDLVAVSDPENTFTLGYQIGAGLQLGRLGIDLRYESAFSENNALLTEDVLAVASIDTRPSVWLLSISYFFGSNKDN